MLVGSLEVRDLRSLDRVQVELPPGITSVVGDNGAGKTSMLEALHFALTGRSFRTRDPRELIRFGTPVCRAEAGVVAEDGGNHFLLASVSRAQGRRHLLDGEPVALGQIRRCSPHVAVFSPDLLALVKGPPAERRGYLDRFVAARWPSRSGLRQEYGQVLAQRNALLRRVESGLSPRSELDAWDRALVAAAVPLIEARAESAGELGQRFCELAAELGLNEAGLAYRPRSDSEADALCAALAQRRDSDLQRARTSLGPHLDELELTVRERSLRRYGSQGEQRAGLLALLLAEREALIHGG